MAGRKELGFLKSSTGGGTYSWKEQLARTTLRHVRARGHTYVELRESGKSWMFFCTLCLTPCYSDSVLYSHLKGNLHTGRLATAKLTLLKENPWPFDDGVLFFRGDLSESDQKGKPLPDSSSEKMRLSNAGWLDGEKELAIVSYDGHSRSDGDNHALREEVDADFGDFPCGDGYDLVIPGVLCKDEVSDLGVKYVGVGRIAARFIGENPNEIRRLWCEWLGKVEEPSDKEDSLDVPEHEFAVVTFAYNYNLGRKGLFDDIKYLLPSSPLSESEDNGEVRNKKRKSFSDPEDMGGSSTNQYDSSGEESQSSNNSKLLLDGHDDQILHTRILPSRKVRKELRDQRNLAARRMCDICQQKMLPDKDVAALFNRKTGKLVCSSRNLTGAFHVFHVSCIVHWILLCEYEIHGKQPDMQTDAPKVKRRSRARSKRKDTGNNDELSATIKQICSVFCPECQGTGIHISGDELERPTVPLSEVFKYKLKANDARKAWMKSPEELPNCSIGFCFASESEDKSKENVSPLKLLHFYRASD